MAASRDAGAPKRPRAPLQEEIQKALILEDSLDKAKADLAAAEQATPRDEARVTERKQAIEAITMTLEQSRKRIELMRARGDK